MPSEQEEYRAHIKEKLSGFGSDEAAANIEELIRLRDQIADHFPPYYPPGSLRFLKFALPEDRGNPFGGLLFPHDLSDSDRVEIIEYFKRDPSIIPWNSLGTRAQIIQACKDTGIAVPLEIVSGGCGNPDCPECSR